MAARRGRVKDSIRSQLPFNLCIFQLCQLQKLLCCVSICTEPLNCNGISQRLNQSPWPFGQLLPRSPFSAPTPTARTASRFRRRRSPSPHPPTTHDYNLRRSGPDTHVAASPKFTLYLIWSFVAHQMCTMKFYHSSCRNKPFCQTFCMTQLCNYIVPAFILCKSK